MKLGTYLEQNRIAKTVFAGDVKVTAQTIYRYVAGQRIPRARVMKKIEAATGGQVAPKDWFEPQESAGASEAPLDCRDRCVRGGAP